MNSETGGAAAVMQAAWPQIQFSLNDARRALRYVSRVVHDAAESYQEIQHCRRMIAICTTTKQAAGYAERRDRALVRLNAAADECNAVGADLLDLELGAVRFPARIGGRPVSLLWRIGDEIAAAWRDLEVEQEASGHDAAPEPLRRLQNAAMI